MSVESDWLEGSSTPAKPRGKGGRKRTNGAGDRSRKLECPDCGFIARCSAGALNAAGFPSCGCGARLELANLRDRAQLDWETLSAEIAQLAPAEQNRIYRELGYLDLVVALDSAGRIAAPRRSGDAQKRCQWQGGYCSRYVTGATCPEHTPGGRDAHYADRRGV